jgi:hypothetical protein
MPKTMTTWGAYTKLEAIAAAAERLGLQGHDRIRARVERILSRSSLTKHELSAELIEWRGELGSYTARVGAFLDEATFALLDYLDRPEVKLTGSELLDQLLEDCGAENLVERETAAAARIGHLVSLR